MLDLIAVPGFAQGYGITLGTINALSVLISVLEAIPSLGLQVLPSAQGCSTCPGSLFMYSNGIVAAQGRTALHVCNVVVRDSDCRF